MSGPTSWWPRDAAEHDRELLVELGEEFGAAAHAIAGVLKDLAQQQRGAGGEVRTGFRVIAGKCHLEVDLGSKAAAREKTRRVVERAGEIGWLDDLQIDEDGRRFTARISGWDADSVRGRAAIKKAAQRAAAADADPLPDPLLEPQGNGDDEPQPDLDGGHVPADGDTPSAPSPSAGTPPPLVPDQGDASGSVPVNRAEQSKEEEETRARRDQLAAIAARFAAVDGLAVEETSILSAVLRAERGGHPVDTLVDVALSRAAEYAAAGSLNAGAGAIMHSALDVRERSAAAQLAQASAAARAEFEGRGIGRAQRPRAADLAAAARAEAALLAEQETPTT